MPPREAIDGFLRSPDFQRNVVWNSFAFLVVVLGYYIARTVIGRSAEQLEARHKRRRLAFYLASFVFVFASAVIWLRGANIGIFLGVFGAGLALSLQEGLLCIAGWVYIIARRPFDIGDRIEIGGVRGDVIDIGLFKTTLMEVGNWVKGDQSTGQMLGVPNSFVFRHPDYNASKGFPFVWHEIVVQVTYESNWPKAREIMLRHADEVAGKFPGQAAELIEQMKEKYAIRYQTLTPYVYTRIVDFGIELTLRYLVGVRQRRSTEDEIAGRILLSFAGAEDLEFAYPTQRIVHNPYSKVRGPIQPADSQARKSQDG
ncbi:MAG TPA: mechanosensitive ion channel family protein [Candidatus Brocadiia bacterium]|nr:mechanosensitive ion channel family protein [Candidatus Brocadiia bacterium]